MSVESKIVDLGYEDVPIFKDPDYESAFIGVSLEGCAVYDYCKMVDHLVHSDQMTEEQAREFIDYNVVRALPYMGERHPVIVIPGVD